jgi:inhibitor of KinA sporulation pathway (predicted exonuclease)
LEVVALVKLLDTINIIDVESTCWEGKAPTGQTSEIIEIGICTFDVLTLEPLEKRAILVKPTRSEVSEFCTELTTLTQEEVEHGVSFSKACEILKDEYLSRMRLWGSYGDYDRKMFQRQCREMNVSYPMGHTHLNIKNLFAISRGLEREIGIGGALRKLHIPLVGTHHRGVDDAWNIAVILGHILKGARRL